MAYCRPSTQTRRVDYVKNRRRRVALCGAMIWSTTLAGRHRRRHARLLLGGCGKGHEKGWVARVVVGKFAGAGRVGGGREMGHSIVFNDDDAHETSFMTLRPPRKYLFSVSGAKQGKNWGI
ncbi:hypothetical protein K503DRAFT_342493 [Rhizopogon vinicolor AM-OR11-026]|uniref:Uncharacterized protein n=1 Tax=Rhizopogon vinicolor AM-OR11-026 TaxID=1314800 RepID=A0A1B7MTC7_9AGAM|nr:hypothetical protein K503DRAFT_342493 [Rhizopogon vinicolor AM-OR11-026]